MVERALAVLARREGRLVHLTEALEWLCADLLSGAELSEVKEARLEEEKELGKGGSSHVGRSGRGGGRGGR